MKIKPDEIMAVTIALTPIILLIRKAWIEPDSFAFYNYYCMNGTPFNIPILSKWFFGTLPCIIRYWFAIQMGIWILILITLVYSYKKFLHYPEWMIGITGASLSLIYSVLAIEDDFLAFPLIIYGFFQLHYGRKWVGLGCLLLAYLFWKGTILIGGMIILSAINPFLVFLPVIAYIATSGLNLWGGSAEAMIGYGTIALLPLLFILFSTSKETIRSYHQKSIFWIGLGFFALAIFQAKWALYSILFFPIFLNDLVMDEEWRKKLCYLGAIIFFFSIIGIGLTKDPTSEDWVIIDHAALLQNEGYKVVSFWSIGRFLEFRTGHATQAGGYSGPQDANGAYWLGPEKWDCQTLYRHNLLTLQKC